MRHDHHPSVSIAYDQPWAKIMLCPPLWAIKAHGFCGARSILDQVLRRHDDAISSGLPESSPRKSSTSTSRSRLQEEALLDGTPSVICVPGGVCEDPHGRAANEELQSTDEEPIIVNDELKIKIGELARWVGQVVEITKNHFGQRNLLFIVSCISLTTDGMPHEREAIG
ncbi:hypothetical protein [Paracoccus aminovorans]|uniref:hypothetical protein n=1 Tax=Paracoccus aminovorans TaxID=34004 RepID=UPI001113D8C4|nr:hypothetical protein [Paracoccus aminovorans]